MNSHARFLHGIRLAFLRPVGACFGLPLKQEEEEEAPAADDDLHKDGVGCLLPESGEEGECDAEIYSLQPEFGQDLKHMGILPPAARGEDEEGILPPMQRGDEDNDAANKDLQPSIHGQDEEDEGTTPPIGIDKQEGGRQANEKGEFQPTYARKDEDVMLWPTIGDLSNSEIFPCFVDYLSFEFMHDGKHLLFTYMHTIGGHGKACMVHDDVIIVHAKPRVDPKVKKKTSLLLCLSIHMPFHPGEYGHDGNPSYHHHEPYSFLSLYNESLHPPTHSFAHPTSSSDFSFLVILSKEDKATHEVLQATHLSFHLPFIPLRGSKRCQARERQFQLKMMACSGSKTKPKIRMTKMRLSYITKDVLDPG